MMSVAVTQTAQFLWSMLGNRKGGHWPKSTKKNILHGSYLQLLHDEVLHLFYNGITGKAYSPLFQIQLDLSTACFAVHHGPCLPWRFQPLSGMCDTKLSSKSMLFGCYTLNIRSFGSKSGSAEPSCVGSTQLVESTRMALTEWASGTKLNKLCKGLTNVPVLRDHSLLKRVRHCISRNGHWPIRAYGLWSR